jgi:Fe-S-cluster-containing dehydrogenase component
MCYDRTSAGRKPLCATVCPSGALFFGTREEVQKQRPRSTSVNRFQFGQQAITTRVHLMVPRTPARAEYVDVTAALDEERDGKSVALDILSVVHEGGSPA